MPEVANYWNQVVKMNDYQKDRFVQRVMNSMFNTVSGKTIAIWGFAFKKDTNDARESPAITVCQRLLEEQAHLKIYDPRFKDSIIGTLGISPNNKQITFSNNATDAAVEAPLILLTEWDEFKSQDFQIIYQSMEKPAHFFDGRNLIEPSFLQNTGFRVSRIGKP